MVDIPEIQYRGSSLKTGSQWNGRRPKARKFLYLFIASLTAGIVTLGGGDQSPTAAAAGPDGIPGKSARESVHLRAPVAASHEVAPDIFSINAPVDKASLKALDPHGARMRKEAAPSALSLQGAEQAELTMGADGDPRLTAMPTFRTVIDGRFAGVTKQHQVVVYSLNPELQKFATQLVAKAGSPHVAVVAMDPKTGRILAMAEKSVSIPQLILHSGFPAASIFKLVTTAAALEKSSVSGDSLIKFRGGTYEVDRWNMFPNPSRDRRSMTLSEALGKSCNPVFARVALSYLNPTILRQYAAAFGFNSDIHFDSPLTASRASIPQGDPYDWGRAAAGFGEVTLSPIHAAAMMSGIANGGMLIRPILIDKIVQGDGTVLYEAKPQTIQRIIQPGTASRLLDMMQYTTTMGTSHREFMRRTGVLGTMPVAAKTGTLHGDNPNGINHWFLAAAPATRPEIAVAVISVDPFKPTGKSAYLGRMMMERFFGGSGNDSPAPSAVITKKKHSHHRRHLAHHAK